MMRRAFIALGVSVVINQTANGDTAYVKPSTFTPELQQTVTVEVAFNDQCCEPRYAVRTDTYRIIDSGGDAVRPDRLETYATTSILEHKITTPGTTRISTGERLGRKGEYVQLNGRYHLINSPDAVVQAIPDGTPILTSQTATVSDAYVTVGAPDWGAIRQTVGRLAIQPLVHPNSAAKGTPFRGRILFDGMPLADQTVILTTEMQRLLGDGEVHVRTDETGLFSLNIDHAGIHLIMARMQAPAPVGAKTDIRSYTTSLTLNAQAPDTDSEAN